MLISSPRDFIVSVDVEVTSTPPQVEIASLCFLYLSRLEILIEE
nr:MAG TPA: hypothetical protein [Caudoviricetes sp.]